MEHHCRGANRACLAAARWDYPDLSLLSGSVEIDSSHSGGELFVVGHKVVGLLQQRA